MSAEEPNGRAVEVFVAFLKLGLTSFGGPVAHLGYFRAEFVERRKWLDENSYAELVALCQFLPGPASSQVGIGIGLSRAGYLGAVAAWTAFTLPSAIALVLFAYGLSAFGADHGGGWLHGLKVAAVAVVALAILGMARTLTPDRKRATLAVAAMVVAFVIPSAWGQIAGIVLGGAIGILFLDGAASTDLTVLPLRVARTTGATALSIFLVLLVGLPLLASATANPEAQLFDKFFRVGSLVFGGGHVVLPLLKAEVVPEFVSNDAFLAGYGAAQAIPGPLFTFAAYLGAVIGGWRIGLLCLLGIFLPSFLLVVGVLPFWSALRKRPAARGGVDRCKCCCRRAAARCLLRSSVDFGHPDADRFCACRCRFHDAVHVEDAAVAGGRHLRRCGTRTGGSCTRLNTAFIADAGHFGVRLSVLGRAEKMRSGNYMA